MLWNFDDSAVTVAGGTFSNASPFTEILIQVRDSGGGIANRASIFNPFFTTKESGMRMGLSICRSIVEGSGGRLSGTQNEGAGTTFNVTLPLHPDMPDRRLLGS